MNFDFEKIFKIRDAFVKEYEKIDLYDYQKEFSNNVLKSVFLGDGKTVCSMNCRQSGKTESVCSTINFIICFYFPLMIKYEKPFPTFFNIGVFGPQKEQAQTDFLKIREYVEMIIKKGGFDLQMETANGNTIKIISEKYPPITIYCFTLSPTSHPESKTLHLIIYEESQDLIDFRVDKTASPMGAATNATEVFIGTAGYKRCKFWNNLMNPEIPSITVNDKRALSDKLKKFNETKNPFHLNYEKHIRKKTNELGEDSDEYKTQYRLEWVLERGQFIQFEDLIRLEQDYDITFIDRFHKAYAGVDWGKASDSTIFTVVSESGEVVYWMELQGDDYYNQYQYIVEVLERNFPGVETVFCDATASQDQAVDMLRALISQRGLKAGVEGIKFGAQSKDRMYKNLARLMFPKKAKNFETGQEEEIEAPFLKIPKAFSKEKERFIRQMVDLQKEVKGELWACKHPDGTGYHDDYCDSMALACLGFENDYAGEYKPSIG